MKIKSCPTCSGPDIELYKDGLCEACRMLRWPGLKCFVCYKKLNYKKETIFLDWYNTHAICKICTELKKVRDKLVVKEMANNG